MDPYYGASAACCGTSDPATAATKAAAVAAAAAHAAAAEAACAGLPPGYMPQMTPSPYMQWAPPAQLGLPPSRPGLPPPAPGWNPYAMAPPNMMAPPMAPMPAMAPREPPHASLAGLTIPTRTRCSEREDASGRWVLEPEDVLLLERVFELEKCPGRELRAQLAARLHVKPRQIQVWFQNKRQRVKNGAKPTVAEALAHAVYNQNSKSAEDGAEPAADKTNADESNAESSKAASILAAASAAVFSEPAPSEPAPSEPAPSEPAPSEQESSAVAPS